MVLTAARRLTEKVTSLLINSLRIAASIDPAPQIFAARARLCHHSRYWIKSPSSQAEMCQTALSDCSNGVQKACSWSKSNCETANPYWHESNDRSRQPLSLTSLFCRIVHRYHQDDKNLSAVIQVGLASVPNLRAKINGYRRFDSQRRAGKDPQLSVRSNKHAV